MYALCMCVGNIVTGRKEVILSGHKKGTAGAPVGHTGAVMALAVSSDGKFMVSEDTD